jgi:hypothetical protein
MAGILSAKAGRDMFLGPIHDNKGRLIDAGGKLTPGAPVICTEFGGVNIAPTQGEVTKEWGYTTAIDHKDLLRRIESLVNAVLTGGGHCCGLVYTQLTDIEQEVNGLYSFDRKEKVDAQGVKAILDSAARSYFDCLSLN